MLYYSLRAFQRHTGVGEIVLVLPAEELARAVAFRSTFPKLGAIVPGGPERTDSARAGVAAAGGEYVLVHDAARPLVSGELISRVVEGLGQHPAVAPVLPVTDTLKRCEGQALYGVVNREGVCRIQTPQGLKRSLIMQAYERAQGPATDDTTLLEETMGVKSIFVPGDESNIKVTFLHDLAIAEKLLGTVRTGFGWDAHPMRAGRKLVLGGIEIPSEKGLLGHSDGDALCHAVTDALLGAGGLGDIGTHFPDTDPRFRDADSLGLLRQAVSLLDQADILPESVDTTVILAGPRLGPWSEAMRVSLAEALGLSPGFVSVKAKSGNKLGQTGAGKSCEVYAVATVRVLG